MAQQGATGQFRRLPLVRIDEAPLVTNVPIVSADADTPPSGVGEPGVPPFAPALVTRSSQQPENASGPSRSASNLKPKTSSSVLVLWKEGTMNTKVTTLAVLVASVLVSNVQEVAAQTNPPPSATATRPATTPPGQTSVPNASPPATTTQTTGESNQDATIKKMNEDEKQKVDTKGK
jgi:hypothetical protein